MRFCVFSLVSVLLLLIVVGCLNNEVLKEKTEEAVGTDISGEFKDPIFLANVREIVGKPALARIFASDVTKVECLDVSGSGIKSPQFYSTMK